METASNYPENILKNIKKSKKKNVYPFFEPPDNVKNRKFEYFLAYNKKTKPQIKKCTRVKNLQNDPKNKKIIKKYNF